MEKITFNGIEYTPDFDLNTSYEDMDAFDKDLSVEEEGLLQEILILEQEANVGTHFMTDMLEAVKKGALDYVDSMTDTTDSLSDMKRSKSVSQWDDTQIAPINTSANKSEVDAFRPRTMKEANKSAIKTFCSQRTDGMSESGQKLFREYEEAYSQRTKSLNQLSTDNNSIKRSDTKTNLETLSGLRGYRIGPVVAMPTAEQAKEGYNAYLNENGGLGKTPSSWLYDQNMKQFDTELAKQLGFTSPSQAKAWRQQNKLTVHEGPDGMFMVPSDVHSAARHDGYRSMMSKYMKGEISNEEMNSYIRHEKVSYAKHEVKERGTRMFKGIGLTALKDLMKCGIVVLTQELIVEFKTQSEDKFVVRMMRVVKQSWQHVKNKCIDIVRNLWKNIQGSILSEVLTALNDFFFKIFKNIFKVIRQMWSSIKNAFKIICSNKYSAGEKTFEVTKVLTAGFISVIGFSLNELIEKGLVSIGIPFASFIAECMSGLFAGIMSSVVLMLFDNIKKKYKTKSNEIKLLQLKSRRVCLEIAHMSLDSLKFYKKLDDHIGLTLSPVIAESMSGSVQLCKDLGVANNEICRSVSDVDKLLGF